MKRPITPIMLCLVFAAGPALAHPRELTLAEGRSLALAATKHEANPDAEHLKGFEIEHETEADLPGFVVFHAESWGSDVAIGNLGFYDVNMKTADVWDGVLCTEIHFRRLRRLQLKLRKTMKLDQESYRTFRKQMPPVC